MTEPESQLNWIPIKEIEPNKSLRVFVTDGKKICIHKKTQMKTHSYFTCGSGWGFCESIKGPVTHWAYIPKKLPKAP